MLQFSYDLLCVTVEHPMMHCFAIPLEYSANENKQDFDCVVLGIPMGISVSGAIILFFDLLQ